MQPFRAPRPRQDRSRLAPGMGTIAKGIPSARDKDKDQTVINESPNKSVSERVVSDSEEPTELGLVWERTEMPTDKVIHKTNDGNEIQNPWRPDDDDNNIAPSEDNNVALSEAPSPHLSEFEDYLAQAEARKNVIATAQGLLSLSQSCPVLSGRQQRDAFWESHLQNEKKRLQDAIDSRQSSSDEDDLPIVNTLTSSAAPKQKKKRAPKTLWTYEAVEVASSPASKYWDGEMARERATKRRAKEKFMSSEIHGNEARTNNIECCSDADASREDNGCDYFEQELPSGSEDDDQPIVDTLPSSAAPTSKKKRKAKSLWTYEAVEVASSPTSKYWDVGMSKERTTKQLAKEKLNNTNKDDDGEGCSNNDDASDYNESVVSEHELTSPKPSKRKQRVTANPKKSKGKRIAPKSGHTVQSVLATWHEDTDYGAAFRMMGTKEQGDEVVRLNKSAAKGTKEAMKSKTLIVMYETLCAEKLRDYLIAHRAPPSSMFRTSIPRFHPRLQAPTFLSVGEWVEVDADRTPGWNSEGGIAVIICVHDSFADVKYVFRSYLCFKMQVVTKSLLCIDMC